MTPRYDILTRTSNTPEWLQLRQVGIGASEGAAILGDTVWGTPISVWLQKTRTDVPDIALDNQRMRWGHRNEAAILDAVAEDYPQIGQVLPSEGLLQMVEYPWIIGTLDGRVDSPDYGIVPLEAKNISAYEKRGWINWRDELEVPPKYATQVRQQAFITGAPGGYVAVLFDSADFNLIWVPQSQEFVERHLLGTFERFWNHNVLERVMPKPILGDDLATIWPANPKRRPVVADDITAEQIEAWRETKALKSQVEQQEAALKFYLHLFAEDATAIVAPDGTELMQIRERAGQRKVKVSDHEKNHPDCTECIYKTNSYRLPVATQKVTAA